MVNFMIKEFESFIRLWKVVNLKCESVLILVSNLVLFLGDCVIGMMLELVFKCIFNVLLS